MAIKTYTQQLEEVQSAISKVEATGQSLSSGTRALTRADLGRLYEREKFLRSMAARESGGGIRVTRGVPLD